MIQVTGLFVYPVKSCRAVAVREAEIGPRGFLHDREFLVVDGANRFLTQRDTPRLATIAVAVSERAIAFAADDHGELSVDFAQRDAGSGERKVTIFRDEVMADDCGDEAAEWFSAALGRECRLVRVGGSFSRAVPQASVPETHRGSAPISFTDAFPTLLTSEASLAELNNRLAHAIPMNRFRPNIVVGGAGPFEEDTWTRVRVRDVVLDCAAACMRCVITTTDQQTGARDGDEPLRTLATYRRAPDASGVMFGRYLVHSSAGVLRVDDVLEPEYRG